MCYILHTEIPNLGVLPSTHFSTSLRSQTGHSAVVATVQLCSYILTTDFGHRLLLSHVRCNVFVDCACALTSFTSTWVFLLALPAGGCAWDGRVVNCVENRYYHFVRPKRYTSFCAELFSVPSFPPHIFLNTFPAHSTVIWISCQSVLALA